MLKKKEKMNQTTLESCLLNESNGSSTMKIGQSLGPISEKAEMFDCSSYNIASPVLQQSTCLQDRELQLERKFERMQSSIEELKSLILKQK